MNLDKELILGLLHKDEIAEDDRLKLLNAVNHKFTKHSQQVLDFIVKHKTVYGSVPKIETVKEVFTEFGYDYGNEPYIFYLEKAVEHKKIRHIQSAFAKVEDYIKEGKIDIALAEYSLSARDFESMDVRSQDISVTASLPDYIKNYKNTRETGVLHGLYTGIKVIDDTTFGVMNGDFWVIAGRPGTLKTYIMCHLFVYMARNNDGNILFFSKEMTKEQIQARVNAIVGGISFKKLRRYQLDDTELDRLEEKAKSIVGNLIIVGRDTRMDYDIPFVKSKIVEYQPKIAFVDGLYLFSKTSEWGDQTTATRSLRDIAISTGCPIVGTTQFNRSKGKKDQDNIAYSDSFLQDASVLLGLDRIYDEVLEKYKPSVKVSTLKVRDDEGDRVTTLTPDFVNSILIESDTPPADSADIIISALG